MVDRAADHARSPASVGAMSWLVVPPTITNYLLPMTVLDSTESFLAERGALGVEGTALWLGSMQSATDALITSLHVPKQVAYRTPAGLAVEVTPAGMHALIVGMDLGTFALIRVHSHGEAAYHSPTDDQNLILSHHGAISIVVPNLGRDGIDLLRCSVNELRHGSGWHELTADDAHRRIRVIDA